MDLPGELHAPPRCYGAASALRHGEPVGQVTSAAYGATVGASVGLAYVRRDQAVTSEWLAGAGFEVDLAGERLPVTATLKARLAEGGGEPGTVRGLERVPRSPLRVRPGPAVSMAPFGGGKGCLGHRCPGCALDQR